MANSDKLIGIFPNTGAGSGIFPEIRFVGSGNQPISLFVQDNNDLTVSSSGTQNILVINQSGVIIKQGVFENLVSNMVYVNNTPVSVSGHNHSITDVVSLSGILDNKLDNDDVIVGGFF